jgi:hypothetical protein
MDSTPVDLIEAYFDVELNRRGIEHLDGVSESDWIDFAKQYQATMDRSFASEFLNVSENASAPIRLYFEPMISHRWDAAVRSRYPSTPLLGIQPDPHEKIDADSASRMLEPLKRHLLVADSVFIRDSFYYCFDWLSDYGHRDGWQDDVVQRDNVPLHISRLKAWLPLLMELRPLIETRALVFMPYWLTPSFPYANYTIDRMNELKLGLRPAPDGQPSSVRGAVDESAVIHAWLNARLMGLDPVFPDRAMYDLASALYFRDDEVSEEPLGLTSDLISLDILPLGKTKPVTIKDLLSLRKNEEGFAAVRSALTTCQERLQKALTAEATQADARTLCEEVIRDRLSEYGGKTGKVIKMMNENPAVSTALGVAVSVAMLPTAGLGALFGIGVPALLSPALAQLAVKRRNPESRALAQLQAIL